MALAWPMVAVLAILCATVLIQLYVPAKRELAELRNSMAALMEEVKKLRGEAEMPIALVRATSNDLSAMEKEHSDLKARLAKLELGRLGRAG